MGSTEKEAYERGENFQEAELNILKEKHFSEQKVGSQGRPFNTEETASAKDRAKRKQTAVSRIREEQFSGP